MNRLRKNALALAILAAFGLAACGGGDAPAADDPKAGQAAPDGRATALAANVSAAGVLRFSFGPQNHDARITVGPAAGQVQVQGVAGVPDGTNYSGIRAIEWVDGAGDSRLVFEVTQAADFDISVDTAAGNAEIDVKWTVPAGAPAGITPSVFLAGGAGQKKIQVQLESFAADVAFAVRTAFGPGDTEFRGETQFKQGSVIARPTFDLAFGSGLVKAELTVDSEARQLFADISPRGAGELSVKVLADDPSDLARVDFRPVGVSGGSKIGFEMVSSAPRITLNHAVTGGAGMDEVKLLLTTLAAASIQSNLALDLGQGSDKLGLGYFNLPGGTLTLRGRAFTGGLDDEALLEATGNVIDEATLDCGDGIDKAIGWRTVLNCEFS